MTQGRIIGVLGAAGGVGASCLVVGLAVRAAAQGRSVVVVDGRPGSSGLDVLAGVEHVPGLRWPDLARVRGAVDGDRVRARLPEQGRIGVLSHARRADDLLPSADVVAEVASAVAAECDLCVIDLDRPDGWGTGLWPMVDDAVLVVPNHVPGLAASAAVAPMLLDRVPRSWLALRTGGSGERARGSRSAAWTTAEFVSEALAVPLAGLLPHDPRVEGQLRRGLAPGGGSGPFQRACDTLLGRLDEWSRVA